MPPIDLNSAMLLPLYEGASRRTLGSKLAECCSVTDFGAVGDGIADDTAAIQATINYVIYGTSHKYTASQATENHPTTVFFPKGEYKITETLHCGYGIDFVHCSLIGQMPQDGYTAIRPTFNDRPALAISGVRSVLVDGLAIVGVNLSWLQNYWTNVTNRADRTNWAGPNMALTSLSRHAPYAGIAIDPYAGRQPSTAYPDVTFPTWMGSTQQYGKSSSSGVRINNCVIRGFGVGVVVQPGDADANGDYVMLTHSKIQQNIVAFGLGNSQARTSNFVGNLCTHCHTAIDGISFGRQRGNVAGEISGNEFSMCYQLFNINMGYTRPIHVSNCYIESGYRLGLIGYNQRALNPLKFSGCSFSFDQMTTKYEYTPPALLECSPSHMVEFDSCNFETPNATMFVIGTKRATLNNCRIYNRNLFDTTTIGGKIAKTVSLGLWDDLTPSKRQMDVGAIRPMEMYDFTGKGRNAADDQTIDCDLIDVDNYHNRPIPIWTKRIGRANAGRDCEPSCFFSSAPFTARRTGREYAVTINIVASTVNIHKGAIVSTSTNLFYVKTARIMSPAVDLVLVQLTNVRLEPNGEWSVKPGSELESAHLYFWNAARFYPAAVPAYLDATADSNSATIRTLGDSIAGGPSVEGLTVGDFYEGGHGLANSSLDATVFQNARVASIAPASGLVTFETNKGTQSAARFTRAVAYPLFIKGSY